MQGSPTPDWADARRLLIGVVALGLLLVAVFTAVALVASSENKPAVTRNGEAAPEASAAPQGPPPPPESPLQPVASGAQSSAAMAGSPTFVRDGVTVVSPDLRVSSVDLPAPTAEEKNKSQARPADVAKKDHSAARSPHRSRTAARHSRPPHLARAMKNFIASLFR